MKILNVTLGLSRLAFIKTWAAALGPIALIVAGVAAITFGIFKMVEAQKASENLANKNSQRLKLRSKTIDRLNAARKLLGKTIRENDKEGEASARRRIKFLKEALVQLEKTGKVTSPADAPEKKKKTVENVAAELAAQEKLAQEKMDVQQAAANTAAEQEAARTAQARLDLSKSTNEILLAELRGATAEELAIIKEKNELEIAEAEALLMKEGELRNQELANIALQKQLLLQKEAEFTQTKEEARLEAHERQFAFEEELNALNEEQRLLFSDKELEDLQKLLLTEEQIRKQFADEKVREEIRRRNQFEKDTIKHGIVIARINAVLNSNELDQFSQFTNNLVKFSRSKNETLKKIAQVAAITQITIDTAKGTVAAFNGMVSTIPGPPGIIAGGIAAGVVITNGVIAATEVLGAQKGGIVRGTTGDTNPFMLAKGELITPQPQADTFKAVIAKEQNRIEAQEGEDFDDEIAVGRGGEIAEVVIGFEDNADEFITAEQRQSRVLETNAA